MICGEINERTQMGGYVGFVPFAAGVAIPRAFIIMPKPDVLEYFPEVVRRGQANFGCLNS
jgi:hypothetical protein